MLSARWDVVVGLMTRWAWWAATLPFALAFALVLALVTSGWSPLRDLDTAVGDALNRYALDHDWVVRASSALSVIGSRLLYVPLFAALVLVLLWQGRRRSAAFIIVTAIGSELLNTSVKTAVDRSRPMFLDPLTQAPGSSFPSGHAQEAAVAAAMVLIVYLPALRGAARSAMITVAAVAVVAIGLSRVVLGVHYLSDVVGGYLLGAAWTMVVAALLTGSPPTTVTPQPSTSSKDERCGDDQARPIPK